MSSSTKLLIKKITLRTLYIIFGFNLLVWIFSPAISHYFISDYLENKLNLMLSDETSIRINLFTSHLTISDLSIIDEGINSEKQTVFAIKSLNVEIRLHRLIANQLYISEFSINGLYLLVEKQADLLRVSGLNILPSDDIQNKESETKPLVEVATEEVSTFEVLLPRFSFSESEVLTKFDGVAHSFKIEKLSIKALLFSNQEQTLNLALRSTFDLAPVNLNSKVVLKEFKGLISSDFELSNFNLEYISQFLPESIKQLKGNVSFNHSNQIILNEVGVAIDSRSSEIKLNGIVYQDDLLKASQKSLNLSLTNLAIKIGLKGEITSQVKNIDLKIDAVQVNAKFEKDQFLVDINEITSNFENLNINMPKDEKLSVEVNGVFNVNQLSSYANDRSKLIAQFDSFDAGKITLHLAEKLNVEIEELGVTNAVYSKIISDSGENNDGMLGFSRFAINDFLLDDEFLSIDNVKLSGLYGNISIGENGEIKNSVSLVLKDNLSSKDEPNNSESNNEPEPIAGKPQADKITKEIKKDALRILVKNIEVVDSKPIVFTDQSVSPEYKREIYIDALKMTDLDSSKPKSESPFVFKGRSDKYTKIDFMGFVKPFTNKLSLKLEGALLEVSLPPVSGYVKKALTFEFESGELDTYIDLEIKDAIISGSTLIKIRGMALASADNHDQNVLQEQTSLPLNVALDMLKDSDDNVELDIPMYGDIDSPVFGISSFIGLITKKAVQSVATDYLMQTFVPYASVVSLTLSAADFLMTLRFEDLFYENGQTEISESQMEYMNQFVALMKDKKNAQVKVCAIATESELGAIGFVTSSRDEKLISQEKVKALKLISKNRMTIFEDYVVEQGVESSRILLCSPKVDLTPEVKPIIIISV